MKLVLCCALCNVTCECEYMNNTNTTTQWILISTSITLLVLVAVLIAVGVGFGSIGPRPSSMSAQSQKHARVIAGSNASSSLNSGRVVLVTGGTSGIGLATAKLYADRGARAVVVCGRMPTRWENAKQTLTQAQQRVIEYVQADVRVEQDVISLMQHIEDTYGRLDVAINNAGVAAGAPIMDQNMQSGYAVKKSDPTDHDKTNATTCDGQTTIAWTLPAPQKDWVIPCKACDVMSMQTPVSPYCENSLYTDALGTAVCMKHELMLMRKRNPQETPGSIVNVASVNSFWGAPGASMYAAGKAAVLLLTRSVAAEQGEVKMPTRPIRVNCVAPGPVDTPLLETQFSSKEAMNKLAPAGVPLGRVASPDEIARGIYFLSDDAEASYVTGACLVIDGGLMASPILNP